VDPPRSSHADSRLLRSAPRGLGVTVRQVAAQGRPFSREKNRRGKKGVRRTNRAQFFVQLQTIEPEVDAEAGRLSSPCPRRGGKAEGVRGLLLGQGHRQAPFSNARAAQRSQSWFHRPSTSGSGAKSAAFEKGCGGRTEGAPREIVFPNLVLNYLCYNNGLLQLVKNPQGRKSQPYFSAEWLLSRYFIGETSVSVFRSQVTRREDGRLLRWNTNWRSWLGRCRSRSVMPASSSRTVFGESHDATRNHQAPSVDRSRT